MELRRLVKDKQETIYDKEKIIRKFIMEKTEFVDSNGGSESRAVSDFFKANLTIEALKNEIQKLVDNERRLETKVRTLEKKAHYPYPFSGKETEYQQIIESQREKLCEVEEKTRLLKKELRRVEDLKEEVINLSEKIRELERERKEHSKIKSTETPAHQHKIVGDPELLEQFGNVD